MEKTMSQLPDNPSDLIRLALDDLRKVEKDDDYYVDMRFYHMQRAGVCQVCLAGCVIAGTLGMPKGQYLDPCDFDEDTENKLFALNEFRSGDIGKGVYAMGCASDKMKSSTEYCIVPYWVSSSLFKAGLTNMANYLERLGL